MISEYWPGPRWSLLRGFPARTLGTRLSRFSASIPLRKDGLSPPPLVSLAHASRSSATSLSTRRANPTPAIFHQLPGSRPRVLARVAVVSHHERSVPLCQPRGMAAASRMHATAHAHRPCLGTSTSTGLRGRAASMGREKNVCPCHSRSSMNPRYTGQQARRRSIRLALVAVCLSTTVFLIEIGRGTIPPWTLVFPVLAAISAGVWWVEMGRSR